MIKMFTLKKNHHSFYFLFLTLNLDFLDAKNECCPLGGNTHNKFKILKIYT
jgi:hypothetical protein